MVTDLKDALDQCKKSAQDGQKIATKQKRSLENTLEHAHADIQSTLYDFQNSPCYMSGATDQLSQQLGIIDSSFNNLSAAFSDDLQSLRDNLGKFSITLFGRTMAGKSTLMEILTQGDGASIGTGAQRTTRDVRKYSWNQLVITDVPGIGAFEGEEDEYIAFEAAKTADLILFLITDDAPQAAEAECFAKILALGKPVVCIMNVKAAVSENKSITLAVRDIEKRFDIERLKEIRRQFLQYSELSGQEWNRVPFVYTHLKAAYLAQNTQDESIAEKLRKVSRIEDLENSIINQVRSRGAFYRVKTFIDIISVPMLSAMEDLLNQAYINSTQGRTILSKKRSLEQWKEEFSSRGQERITALVTKIRGSLNLEVAAFAEDHFGDPDADKAWNAILKKRKINDQCQELLDELKEQCDNHLQEISREISNELKFSSLFSSDSNLSMRRVVNGKRIWNWSSTIVGGGLTIAWIIAGFIGAACAGPLGWIALATSLVGFGGSFLFKSREKKEHEARLRLERNLRGNISTLCESLKNQLSNSFSSGIIKHIDSLIKEIARMNHVIFQLADTQRRLAWGLDEHLLELNKSFVTEGIKLIHSEGLEYHIVEVARIPGVDLLMLLNPGTVFPEEEKNNLKALMSESIGFVINPTDYNTNQKKVFISRILGRDVDRSAIRMEEDIGVAHVPLDSLSSRQLNRVRMAQQLVQIAIIK